MKWKSCTVRYYLIILVIKKQAVLSCKKIANELGGIIKKLNSLHS